MEINCLIILYRYSYMQDGGAAGMMVPLAGNGDFELPGFSGSAVSRLNIRVDNYAALKTLVINDYAGRLVDILDVQME